MSNRLDQQREKELEPERLEGTRQRLVEMGFDVRVIGEKRLEFEHKGATVRFWPYSGWHTGKTIRDGRGFAKLQKQLKQ